LHAQEKEQAPPKTLKQPIGKPQKKHKKLCLYKRKSSKKKMEMVTPPNWQRQEINKVLTLINLPPIFVVMKKHCDLTSVLHYLKTFHKKSRKVIGPYEKLNKGSFYNEWLNL
jgi:hypothetical protein